MPAWKKLSPSTPLQILALALLACERPPASPDPAPGQPFSGERARERLGQLLRLPRALGDPRRSAAIDELAPRGVAVGDRYPSMALING